MFSGCYKFNQPLNNWDVSNVENMDEMFYHCNEFQQSLNDWNVSDNCGTYDMFLDMSLFDEEKNAKWYHHPSYSSDGESVV